jgi:predicted RNA polymerase sigma factor
MSRAPLGPYQVQAAIAAVHGEAARAEDTDWPQILALYGLLQTMTDIPIVVLNQAVAAQWSTGPRSGWPCSGPSTPTTGFNRHHRLDAVRAHLLEMAGDREAALAHYRAAARRTTSTGDQRYLNAQVSRLTHDPP